MFPLFFLCLFSPFLNPSSSFVTISFSILNPFFIFNPYSLLFFIFLCCLPYFPPFFMLPWFLPISSFLLFSYFFLKPFHSFSFLPYNSSLFLSLHFSIFRFLPLFLFLCLSLTHYLFYVLLNSQDDAYSSNAPFYLFCVWIILKCCLPLSLTVYSQHLPCSLFYEVFDNFTAFREM
jgi:hypothetical protein